MLSALRKVLSFEMTIAEWIGTPVMLAAPYLIIGVLWSIVWRPALLLSTVCLA